MYGFVILTAIFSFTHATYVISLYGDVYKDVEFFSRTYPWVIDNIGGEVTVDYYLLGSGKYSVPQMCALNELRMNSFLQAQFLKCEAEENPSVQCLCDVGIDPQRFKQCVRTKGNYASLASSKYSQLGIDASPIVEIGYKNTIFGVDDSWYLKKICTIFGDNPPRGCVKPFACNATIITDERKGLAVFDCIQCEKLDVALKVIDNTSTVFTTSTTAYNQETTEGAIKMNNNTADYNTRPVIRGYKEIDKEFITN